jgi:hypothetical protein
MSKPMTNAEIVALAHLTLAIDRSPDDKVLLERLELEMNRLNGFEAALMVMARKLLEGRSYIISTDNPTNAARACSLAEYMGATIIKDDPSDPWVDVFSETRHRVRFDPPVAS